MLKCIIIDDEENNIAKLQGYVQRTDTLELVFTTTDPIEGMKYIQAHDPDLIFLDIQMEELSGMDLAKMLIDKKKIVFTTASDKYTIGAFEEGVLDYILKPFGYARFEKAVQKALEYKKSQQEKPTEVPRYSADLFIKGDTKGQLTRVRLEDIFYVEGLGNYLMFYTKNGPQVALITLRDLEERLPYPQFVRIHKSYIVAYNHILALRGGEVVIKTEKKEVALPIGAIYRERFLQLIQAK